MYLLTYSLICVCANLLKRETRLDPLLRHVQNVEVDRQAHHGGANALILVGWRKKGARQWANRSRGGGRGV